MADSSEREPTTPESSGEKLEASELKKLERKEATSNKAEIEAGKEDLEARHEAAEKRLSVERKKESDLEREKKTQETLEKEPPKKAAGTYTKKDKQVVYKKEIKTVQAQLPRASRAFSKVIHNTAVEAVSNATGKTVFRPSALVGGAVVGLAAGLTVYAVARYYGYIMPSWILPILLILGALFGVAAELILNRFRHEEGK